MRLRRTHQASLVLAAGALALGACGSRSDEDAPAPTQTEEQRSIFAEGEAAEPVVAAPALAPLETTIAFPEGSELTEEARAELATVLRSPQVGRGGQITLRGHSDAGGSDEANMRASQDRAEAVAAFLIDGGVPEDRIEIIAFGEQNPIAPNALPDGTPNEEGRRQNRRVDLHVASPDADTAPEPEQPTLAETLAGELEGETAEARAAQE